MGKFYYLDGTECPPEYEFDQFKVVPRHEHHDASTYYSKNGSFTDSIRLGEAIFVFPDYERKGVWTTWSGNGKAFISFGLFASPKKVADVLFKAGCKINAAHRTRIRDYLSTAYADETAVTPKDLMVPGEALKAFIKGEGAE